MAWISRIALGVAGLIATTATLVPMIQKTIWWAGYDLRNCPGCQPRIDWSEELTRNVVGSSQSRQIQRDGVIVLPQAVSVDKVNALAGEVDGLSHTFMTDVISNTLLAHYLEYEHRLDTRSELVRDWAIHGPLGKWAAQLMGVEEVRLYNAEKIYHRGTTCNSAWHRDTVAAPFPTEARSLTFNVYLDDMSGDNDVLIFIPGSHHNMSSPPRTVDKAFEPQLKVGDVLVHDPRIYHTPSARGCWRRRSLQFRYVEAPTTFEFGPNRFPHGPFPWTFAHALAPHGLKEGDALAGPGYPLVYPKPVESEHVPLPGKPWALSAMLGMAKQAQDIAQELGIGSKDNCTVAANAVKPDYFGFDGPVTDCEGWEMVGGVPLHRDGQMIITFGK